MSREKIENDVVVAGAIRRITVKNFVTYKHVELLPGPNLNLIIGPNGSGKSTIVCAIILGLCGKTSAIGRGKNLRDFVKRGEQEALIEIELCRGGKGNSVVIKRTFNVENNTEWRVDGNQTSERDVRKLIESLNIQVDNPCQLLPQDRVKDFSRMNPQQLLRNTILAICGNSAIELFEKLISLQNKSFDNNDQLNTLAKQLEEEEKAVQSLHSTIKEMERMEKINEEIDICNKKILWCEYDIAKQHYDDCDHTVKVLEKDKRNKLVSLEPSKKRLNELDATYKILEKSKSSHFSSVAKWNKQITDYMEQCDLEENKVQELQNEWLNKIDQQKNHKREIEQAKLQLSKMKSDQENLISSFGNESTLTKEISKLLQPISNVNAVLDKQKNLRADHLYDIESKIDHEIRLHDSRLNKLKDVDNKKLETLKNLSEDAYQALIWLRENRQMFSSNVYEPMLLELNFTEPQFAKYTESTISHRDLLAFTFENIDDMNLFIKKTRGELGFKTTNAVCSMPTNELFSPPVNLDNLKSYGFYTYMIDTITGPRAILNYLCKQYRMHCIPIGDENTYKYSDKVPSNIKLFYSANHKFFIKVSAYSGSKLTSTNEIQPARILVNSIDHDAIKGIQDKLNHFIKQKQHKLSTIKNIDIEISELDKKLNSFFTKKQKLSEQLTQVKTITSRVRIQENKIITLEEMSNFDIEREKNEHVTQLYKCSENQLKTHKKISLLLRKLNENFVERNIIEHKFKAVYEAILAEQNSQSQCQAEISDLDKRLTDLRNNLSKVYKDAKSKLLDAKKATGVILRHQEGFPFADRFSSVPDDLDELQRHSAYLQSAIKRLEKNDSLVTDKYEQHVANVKRLKDSIKNTTKSNEQDKSHIEGLRNSWLGPLEEKLQIINETFSKMFSQLKCAGQVQLSKNEKYEKYGIDILVKFRANETLHQLSERQSGGERSIATALYLLSLQQFSQFPFRGVDEINQGMDAINEEDMYKFLINLTSDDTTPVQYFLVTPKLLYNIEYTPAMNVHVVMSGPRAVKHDQWKKAAALKL